MLDKTKDVAEEPSEEFIDAVSCCGARGGTIYSTCCFCGRTYFSSEAGYDYEKGELEDLQAKSEKEPDAYIDTYDVSIGTLEFAGHTFLLDCACNALRWYEDFVWGNRGPITAYLKTRAERQLRKAVDDADKAWQARSLVDKHDSPPKKTADGAH